MNITLINVILCFNLICASIINRRPGSFPLASFLMLLSSIGYAVAVLSFWGDQPGLIWISITLSVFFYFFKFIKGDEGKADVLDAFLGLLPILVTYTNDLLVLFLYCLGILFSRHILLDFRANKESRLSMRFQYLDGFSVVTFLVSLALMLASFGSFSLNGTELGMGLSSIALPACLLILSFVFAGFFYSSKDNYRFISSSFNGNLVFGEIFLKAYLPGVFVVKASMVLDKLEFDKFTYSQNVIALLIILAAISIGFRLLTFDRKIQSFYKIFYLMLTSYYLLVLDASEYFYLLSLVGLKAMFLAISYVPKSGLGKNLKGLLSYMILPSAVSPFVWLILIFGFRNEGASANLIVLTSLIVSVIGFLAFNNLKLESVEQTDKVFHISQAGLASMTIMTAFFAVLFAAKILT